MCEREIRGGLQPKHLHIRVELAEPPVHNKPALLQYQEISRPVLKNQSKVILNINASTKIITVTVGLISQLNEMSRQSRMKDAC